MPSRCHCHVLLMMLLKLHLLLSSHLLLPLFRLLTSRDLLVRIHELQVLK